MPSAANAKSEKPAPSEAMDNSPIRQIMTILEHKIRNLEKRKSKLTSYRDLQKAGKELNSDQKIAVAKYDEVAQTLEFARDLSKQVTAIAIAAERDAKKQAKRDAWVRNTSETNKIRDVLLILDCLMQMGNTEVRNDFLSGSNGAVKLNETDLKLLDDLYPEVTPSHKLNAEGQSEFHLHVARAAEHLYAIIDGKPKEILGTTYSHIKEIITNVQICGYFDRSTENVAPNETEEEHVPVVEEEPTEPIEELVEPELSAPYPPAGALPVPPAPAVVPAPAYPLRPLPPITLQEVEHAYFAQQYPQQRPIAEVIGSQNFFFLQESEIDSPIGTPQPPPIPNQLSPPAPIPTQTFTNQHFVQMPGTRVPEPGALPLPPPPHFPPHPEHTGFPPAPIALAAMQHVPQPVPHTLPPPPPLQQQVAHPIVQHTIPASSSVPGLPEEHTSASPLTDREDDAHKESRSPEQQDDITERKTQVHGDGQNRYRRFGRGGNRGMPNGHRGRGTFPNRQSGDGYRGRQSGEYQNRLHKDNYQSRQYDNYQSRHTKDAYVSRSGNDGYYGNGDAADLAQHGENGGRERYSDGNQSYQGGFKGRGRGGPRGAPRGTSRPPRSHQFNRKPESTAE